MDKKHKEENNLFPPYVFYILNEANFLTTIHQLKIIFPLYEE